MSFRLIYIAVLLAGIASCKTYKVSSTGERIPRMKGEELAVVVDSCCQFEYHTFSTRIKLDYEDQYGKESGFAHVRMVRDSIIWISLRKVSIEGARIVITPDSVHILDRTNKQYFPLRFQTFMDRYGVDFEFSELQDLVVGNALSTAGDWDFGWQQDQYYWRSETQTAVNEFWIDPYALHIARMRVTELPGLRSMDIQADKYESVGEQPFSTVRKLTFSDGALAEVELIYSKMEKDADNLSFNFDVNPKYEVILTD